jgi:hypothetical protein
MLLRDNINLTIPFFMFQILKNRVFFFSLFLQGNDDTAVLERSISMVEWGFTLRTSAHQRLTLKRATLTNVSRDPRSGFDFDKWMEENPEHSYALESAKQAKATQLRATRTAVATSSTRPPVEAAAAHSGNKGAPTQATKSSGSKAKQKKKKKTTKKKPRSRTNSPRKGRKKSKS